VGVIGLADGEPRRAEADEECDHVHADVCRVAKKRQTAGQEAAGDLDRQDGEREPERDEQSPRVTWTPHDLGVQA
jgi:hypothetical protein